MEPSVWNLGITAVLTLLGFLAKSKLDHFEGRFNEMDEIRKLVIKTREEIARDHVTRAEMNTVVEKLGDRFDRAVERLESKIDSMNSKD